MARDLESTVFGGDDRRYQVMYNSFDINIQQCNTALRVLRLNCYFRQGPS